MKIYFGGGINEQSGPDINEAGKGSYNFQISNDINALIPRDPFDLLATAPNAGSIRGLIQLVKRDDTETTLVQAGATVYDWNGASGFTNVGSCDANSQLRDTYWSLDDTVVITDLQKLTPVSQWNGTSFSTLTTGLADTLYARYGIVHNNRIWLFNVKTSTDTPHLMVASAFENQTSFDTTNRAVTGTFTTGLEAFYILTPDLRPINGVAKTIAGDLVISTTEGALFKLTGTDAKDYTFVQFYPGSNAVGLEAMVSIGNDVTYMKKHGNIDLLSATQAYGDVTADDISRWIPDTVRGLTDAIAVYDQTNQKVLFFVTDKILVFFKDVFYGGAPIGEKGQRARISPWSIYRTNDASSFNTKAAKYMRLPGTTNYTVVWGDNTGRIFNLNGSGVSGDAGSEDIDVVRKTRHMYDDDQIDFRRHVLRGRIQYRRLNAITLSLTFNWDDEFNEITCDLHLKGSVTANAYYYSGPYYHAGLVYYGESFSGQDVVSHINFSPNGRGPGCFMTCSTSTSKKYQVDHVDLY